LLLRGEDLVLHASISFALFQYLVFAYQAVAWYTAAMQLLTR